MKKITPVSILALLLLAVGAPQSAAAQTGESSASGTYRFLSDDDLIRYVEFDSRGDGKGNASGRLFFNDPSKIMDADVDDDAGRGDTPPEFYIKATLDTMTVDKNRAVMGGPITESSHRTYLGRWVQLVVEDNGLNTRVPDTLTWGICRPPAGNWIPTDAERDRDDGAFMSWWATDAERKDDVGMPSPNLIPGDMKGCRVFPMSAYTYAGVRKWEGDIQVVQQ